MMSRSTGMGVNVLVTTVLSPYSLVIKRVTMDGQVIKKFPNYIWTTSYQIDDSFLNHPFEVWASNSHGVSASFLDLFFQTPFDGSSGFNLF